MMNSLSLHGITITPKGILFLAAAAQWLLLVIITLLTRRRGAAWKKSESVLVFSTLLFAGVWYEVLFRRKPNVELPMTAAPAATRSCAGINRGDTEASVKKALGEPDHVIGEEDTRGPGSNALLYEDIRCAVHLYGDRVDSIE